MRHLKESTWKKREQENKLEVERNILKVAQEKNF